MKMKAKIKQNVWLYVSKIYMYFFEKVLISCTLCGRRMKACEEAVTRPSTVNKLTHLSKADRQAQATLS